MKRTNKKDLPMSYRDLEEFVKKGNSVESIGANEIENHLDVLISIDLRGDSETRLNVIRRIILRYLKQKPVKVSENIKYLLQKCVSSDDIGIREDAINLLSNVPDEVLESSMGILYSEEIQYSRALPFAEKLFLKFKNYEK